MTTWKRIYLKHLSVPWYCNLSWGCSQILDCFCNNIGENIYLLKDWQTKTNICRDPDYVSSRLPGVLIVVSNKNEKEGRQDNHCVDFIALFVHSVLFSPRESFASVVWKRLNSICVRRETSPFLTVTFDWAKHFFQNFTKQNDKLQYPSRPKQFLLFLFYRFVLIDPQSIHSISQIADVRSVLNVCTWITAKLTGQWKLRTLSLDQSVTCRSVPDAFYARTYPESMTTLYACNLSFIVPTSM